jgi:hypothetical protein
MEKKDYIREELSQISRDLHDLGGAPGYAVPQGYFEGLPAVILGRIQGPSEAALELLELSPLLSSLPRKMPFQVPEGYFETVRSGILEELKSGKKLHSPDPAGVEGWPKIMPYRVPEGYFDHFSRTVLQRISVPAKTRVISIKKMPAVLRYAAAAVITGFLALGAGIYFQPRTVSVDTQLAGLSDQSMTEYLQYRADPLDNETIYSEISTDAMQENGLVSSLSDDDLKAYLDNTVPVSEHELN